MIREITGFGIVVLIYVKSAENLADLGTKALVYELHYNLGSGVMGDRECVREYQFTRVLVIKNEEYV